MSPLLKKIVFWLKKGPLSIPIVVFGKFALILWIRTWTVLVSFWTALSVLLDLSSPSCDIEVGIPQGGVISPLLRFLTLVYSKFNVESFADDIVFGVAGISPLMVSQRIQEDLDLVQTWCTEIGLSVNPLKTVVIPFTLMRSNFMGELKQLKLFGKKLHYSTSVKYLRMMLDSKLN